MKRRERCLVGLAPFDGPWFLLRSADGGCRASGDGCRSWSCFIITNKADFTKPISEIAITHPEDVIAD